MNPSRPVDTSDYKDLSDLSVEEVEFMEFLLKNPELSEEDMLTDPRFNDAGKITKILKAINPYLRSVPGTKGVPFTFSITNMTEEYTKKLVTTGLIGFVYRLMDEYKVSEDIEVIPEHEITPEIMKEYEFIPWEWHDKKTFEETMIKPLKEAVYEPEEGATEEEIAKGQSKFNHEMATNTINLVKERQRKLFMHKHCIIKKFLDSAFRYNPDRHARTAYAEPSYMVEQDELIGSGLRPSLKKKLNKYRNQLMEGGNKFTERIPPRDIFLRFHRYLESNYEKIQDAVHMLYHERPEIDLVLNVHEIHKDMDDAKAYRDKYRDQLITDIYTSETGQYCMLAPYKENRSKLEFFNKDTRHLEEIIRQKEADLRLSREMLKKRVQKKKAKNVKEHGADSAMLKNYQGGMGTMVGDDSKSTFTADDPNNFDPNKTTHDVDPDLPDDAIQINTYSFEDAGKTLKQDSVFIKSAEADGENFTATIHHA